MPRSVIERPARRVIERFFTIPDQVEDVVLCEATEFDRLWYTARMLCLQCKVCLFREAMSPVGAEAAVLEAMEEHVALAHGERTPPAQ